MKINKWMIIGGIIGLFLLVSVISYALDLREKGDGSIKKGFEAEQEELAADEKAVEVSKEVEEVAEPTSRDGEIRKLVTEIHDDKYMGSEVVEIEVNENLGLNDGSYVVLAHFSYTRPNDEEKTLDFVTKYSEDLAARLAEIEDISGVTVFYEAPRFLDSGNATKYTYKRSGDAMVLDNQFISPALK